MLSLSPRGPRLGPTSHAQRLLGPHGRAETTGFFAGRLWQDLTPPFPSSRAETLRAQVSGNLAGDGHWPSMDARFRCYSLPEFCPEKQ